MGDFDAWIGRSQSVMDILSPERSNALSVALGGEGGLAAGLPLPLLHHWLYFWDVQPPSGLGVDGHPAKGGFLPPVPLPNRMWAGGRVAFPGTLLLGQEVTRTSTILSVTEKTGRTGKLVFVTVRHELDAGAGVAVTEEQDLVYRDSATTRVSLPVAEAQPDAIWIERVDPDPVLLFRYSALTMNGHRIHYDRPFAVEQEGYPALVVHGPLQATMLIGLAARNLAGPIAHFSFRGQHPAFDGVPLHVCGIPDEQGAQLWTQQGGGKNMVATVGIRPPA